MGGSTRSGVLSCPRCWIEALNTMFRVILNLKWPLTCPACFFIYCIIVVKAHNYYATNYTISESSGPLLVAYSNNDNILAFTVFILALSQGLPLTRCVYVGSC